MARRCVKGFSRSCLFPLAATGDEVALSLSSVVRTPVSVLSSATLKVFRTAVRRVRDVPCVFHPLSDAPPVALFVCSDSQGFVSVPLSPLSHTTFVKRLSPHGSFSPYGCLSWSTSTRCSSVFSLRFHPPLLDPPLLQSLFPCVHTHRPSGTLILPDP